MREVRPGDSPELDPRRQRKRVSWRVRGTIAATFLIAGLAVLGWPWWVDRDSVLERVHRIEQVHGIKIGYGAYPLLRRPQSRMRRQTRR